MDKVLDELFKWSVPAYVVVLSIWAGTAHNIRRIKQGNLDKFSWGEWLGDIIISSFMGVVTFYFCKYAKIDDMLMAVCVSISAHMGTRAINLFERGFVKGANKLFPLDEVPTHKEMQDACEKKEE